MVNRILNELDINILIDKWCAERGLVTPRAKLVSGYPLEPYRLYVGSVLRLRWVGLTTNDLLLPDQEFMDRFVVPLLTKPEAGPAAPLPQTEDVVAQITKERGSKYGLFVHNAVVAQAVKAAIRNIPNPDNEPDPWGALPLDVREALDLIALKMSRIVTGEPEYLDNWDDIGGYAKIVADRIRRKQGATPCG